jgi:hypothetical protein
VLTATSRNRGHDLVAALLGWLRREAAETPGRLLLLAGGIVAGAVLFWAAASAAESSRSNAATAVSTSTEPLLVQAVQLYTSLSDADATATTTFLTGGLEPPARRDRYLADLDIAGKALAGLGREAASTAFARAAVQTVTGALPIYAGLIESARAYNRQELPIGAAYLREASNLLSTTILPAAKQLYANEASLLDRGYGKGTRALTLIAFLLAAALALAALIYAQVKLYAMSRRVLNVPVVIGTVGLIALAAWGGIGMASEQSALARAQREGSDPVEVLSTMQILVSRLQADESLTLAARGGDANPIDDFAAVLAAVEPRSGQAGFLVRAETLAQRGSGAAAAAELGAAMGAYTGQHNRIVSLVGAGETPQAINVSVGSARSAVSPSDRLTADLVHYGDAAQQRFLSAASDATGSLSGLGVGIPVLTLAIAALALLGVRARIREYA